MGGCASRPKEFDSADAPAPAEAPETTQEVVVPAAQEGEVEKEAPLVDLSEPAEAAPAAAAAVEEEGEKKEEKEEGKTETKKAESETAAPSS